jgi:hypothetical protein
MSRATKNFVIAIGSISTFILLTTTAQFFDVTMHYHLVQKFLSPVNFASDAIHSHQASPASTAEWVENIIRDPIKFLPSNISMDFSEGSRPAGYLQRFV